MDTFTTERLLIRPLEAQDQQLYVELNTDPDVMRLNGGPLTLARAQGSFGSILKRMKATTPTYNCWAITTKDDNKRIGIGYLVWDDQLVSQPTIAITLYLAVHGKGFGTEAKGALIEYGFNRCSLIRICSQFSPENIATQRVNAKLGFVSTPGVGSDEISQKSSVIEKRKWQNKFIEQYL